MKTRFLGAFAFAMTLAIFGSAHAAPTAVNGAVFSLVATGATGTQLFELTSDATGKVYAGNNSNNTIGIPVQLTAVNGALAGASVSVIPTLSQTALLLLASMILAVVLRIRREA